MLSYALIVRWYLYLLEFALPVNIIFGIGNILCNMFVVAVSKGKLTLGDD